MTRVSSTLYLLVSVLLGRDYPQNPRSGTVKSLEQLETDQHLDHDQSQSKTDACVDDGLQQTVGPALFQQQLLQLAPVPAAGALLQKVVQQARQIGQQLGVTRGPVLGFFPQPSPPHLIPP